MPDIKIDIGGEGEAIVHRLTVVGCECRAEDFLMSLIKFANEYRNIADQRTPGQLTVKPCGCLDAK